MCDEGIGPVSRGHRATLQGGWLHRPHRTTSHQRTTSHHSQTHEGPRAIRRCRSLRGCAAWTGRRGSRRCRAARGLISRFLPRGRPGALLCHVTHAASGRVVVELTCANPPLPHLERVRRAHRAARVDDAVRGERRERGPGRAARHRPAGAHPDGTHRPRWLSLHRLPPVGRRAPRHAPCAHRAPPAPRDPPQNNPLPARPPTPTPAPCPPPSPAQPERTPRISSKTWCTTPPSC
jgi:hypothetical protein